MIWRVRLICCGRDDGDVFRDTWGEADEFRQAYISGPGVYDPRKPHIGGCRRAGIIERVG